MSSELVNMIPNLKIEVYDVLNSVFNGYPIDRELSFRLGPSDQLVDGEAFIPMLPNGDRAPNFMRDEFRWKNAVYIIYGGSKIALAQSRPHGMIKILNVRAKDRYIRNMFIMKLHDSFPKVKVMYA